jgi:hypothetical protein
MRPVPVPSDKALLLYYAVTSLEELSCVGDLCWPIGPLEAEPLARNSLRSEMLVQLGLQLRIRRLSLPPHSKRNW